MSYNHGVYNREIGTSLTAPIRGTAGLQVIFGTAPIHLAADPEKAVNVPKLCYSFKEAMEAVGYSDDFQNFTLCQSIDATFRVFNVAPVVLVNVLDPKKPAHTTKNEAATYPVKDGLVIYDKAMVLLASLVIMAGEVKLVSGQDYIAEHDDTGAVVISMLSEAAKAATEVSVASTSLNPAGVTRADVVGGLNAATGEETGLELVRHIYPKLGVVPGILLAPGWSQDPVVAAALQAKTEAINGCFECVTYLDIAADSTGATVYTDVPEAKTKMGATGTHAAAFWPMGAVGDKVYFMSALAAAMTAHNDASNGDVPHDSPSNRSLRITATVLADGTQVVLDQQQANDVLNANGVITAINQGGFILWGNSTAAYPATSDPKDQWLAVRRFFNWDGNNFILTYRQKVDRPGNTRLIQSVVDSQNIIGNGYVARDYCAGYKTEYLATDNPTTELLNGHLTVRTKLAPYIPSEFIENIREYDTDALTAALGGV